MTDEAIRLAGRDVARKFGLDPAATIMVGALATARRYGRVNAVPSAEERAELLALAGDADHFERFVEAASSRASQFILCEGPWAVILGRAERLSAQQAVVC
ncbi:MAG: hypothetical protein ACREJM_06270 [Candidatus Saccharimonadales bacterium]